MATIGGSNIATSGLVLALDAANPKSYVSGSTTWYDLSGNNNHATASIPYYSGSNGGSLYFPDNTTSVFFTPTYTLIPNGGVTMEAFIYPSSDTFFKNTNGNPSGITGRRNTYIYGMDINPNAISGSSANSSAELVGANFGTPTIFSIPNIWYHILWTYSTTSVQSYVNGVNIYSTSGTYSTPTDTAAFQIGKRWGGLNYPLYGNISIVRWYNRPLTSQEVLQNYNAQKSRYNL